jgi:hypothetical protein
VETAKEPESEIAVGDVEKEIGEVEADGVELPEVSVDGEADPVNRAIGEASGSAEVGGEGDGSEQKAMGKGVPVGEGGIVEYLVEVIVEEGCAQGIPVEGENPESADGEETKALVYEAPLEEGGIGRWFGAECRGAASGHALF